MFLDTAVAEPDQVVDFHFIDRLVCFLEPSSLKT
jgi:hypothetical protein